MSDIIFQIKDLLYSKTWTLSHHCGKSLFFVGNMNTHINTSEFMHPTFRNLGEVERQLIQMKTESLRGNWGTI